MEPITAENDSGVALITLCDERTGNTLTAKSLTDLSVALHNAIADSSVRVILLRSSRPAFCLGMSLVDADSPQNPPEVIEKTMSLYCDCLFAMYNAPKPVVCCVTGDVKAGGVGLVAACDIVIATSNASFQLSEIFLGMIPANVMPYLYSLRLAPQTVRYLVLTGKKISAREALEIQLVNEVFPAESVEQDLRSLVKGLFRASPDAVARIKKFTGRLAQEKLAVSIEQAKAEFLEMMGNPEITRAISDFNNGFSPPWFSRFSPRNPLICKGAL
jgi:enoyl-CoA hydratase/carnithine racemase